MSWASGCCLVGTIIEAVAEHSYDLNEPEERIEFYKMLIKTFEDEDCDTLGEVLGEDPHFESAYYQLHPDHREDE